MKDALTIGLVLLWAMPLLWCHVSVYPQYYYEQKHLLTNKDLLESERWMEYKVILSVYVSSIAFIILHVWFI